ncbi:hypothetical protein, partial [Intestinimonas butyriciproducens]|uniref:hypothetical protein n=1 Tax=Intestinimonas butyriciproducens TaxID=1297617 RepID=UPI0019572BFF
GVGIGFDVRAVYKYRLGGKITCLRYLLQNPTEYLVYTAASGMATGGCLPSAERRRISESNMNSARTI